MDESRNSCGETPSQQQSQEQQLHKKEETTISSIFPKPFPPKETETVSKDTIHEQFDLDHLDNDDNDDSNKEVDPEVINNCDDPDKELDPGMIHKTVTPVGILRISEESGGTAGIDVKKRKNICWSEQLECVHVYEVPDPRMFLWVRAKKEPCILYLLLSFHYHLKLWIEEERRPPVFVILHFEYAHKLHVWVNFGSISIKILKGLITTAVVSNQRRTMENIADAAIC